MPLKIQGAYIKNWAAHYVIIPLSGLYYDDKDKKGTTEIYTSAAIITR